MPQTLAPRPDTSLTLNDIILRVAEAAGCAGSDSTTGKATVPTVAHDYDKCLRAVNDGIEMIYRAWTEWSFLDQSLQITMSTDGTGPFNVDSDPGRYRMPWYITTPPKEPQIVARGSGNSTYICPVVNRQKVVLARAQGDTNGGPPSIACIDQIAGPERRSWELIVYPDPDYAYTLEATFRVFAPRLTLPTDRHIMGAAHDQTVIAAAIHAMKMRDSKDPVERKNFRDAFEEAVIQSKQIDSAMNPRNLGQITDPSTCAGGIGYDIGTRNFTAFSLGTP